ncbi:MAG: hypothetical protein ACHQYP_12650 [Nitrospiria bacterium]
MGDIEYPESPFWPPLDSVVGDRCREFEFIGQVKQDGMLIFLYKHTITRKYLNINLYDQTYRYRVDSGRYFLISQEEALNHVFGSKP